MEIRAESRHTFQSRSAQPIQPDPALKQLDILVGTWHISGRVSGQYGEVNGQAMFEWIAGGFFMAQRFHMDFLGKKVEGIEIIGYDPSQKALTATLYSNMGISSSYKWSIHEDTVIHSTDGSKYTGKFSHDYNILTGRWEPEEDGESNSNVAYDATMTRLKVNRPVHWS